MASVVKRKAIAVGFAVWTWSRRARRVLASLGRPRVRAIDHITLPVTDLAAAREFYCEVLGGAHLMTIDATTLARFGRPPAADDGEGTYHHTVLMGGTTRVDLFLQRDGQPAPTRGHPHVAFRVTPGQLLAWKRRLERAGVPTEGPLQLGPPGQASLYFNDPSGNHLELTCFGFVHDIPIRAPRLEGLAHRGSPAPR